MLNSQQGKVLLRLARQAIEEQFGQNVVDPVQPDALNDPDLCRHRGVFVTLTKQGMLRGCIGSLFGEEAIVDGVRKNAINAAFHDYRFSLLTQDELADVRVAVSVLTRSQNLDYTDGDDLIRKLHPNIDGVILTTPDGQGATFLPHVWNQLPVPEIFLEHLCSKAGLPRNSWQNGDLNVQTYQALYFTEEERLGTLCEK